MSAIPQEQSYLVEAISADFDPRETLALIPICAKSAFCGFEVIEFKNQIFAHYYPR